MRERILAREQFAKEQKRLKSRRKKRHAAETARRRRLDRMAKQCETSSGRGDEGTSSSMRKDDRETTARQSDCVELSIRNDRNETRRR